MTDDTAPDDGATDNECTESDHHSLDSGVPDRLAPERLAELEAENEALRERVDALETALAEGRDGEQAADGTGDGPPADMTTDSRATDDDAPTGGAATEPESTPELLTQGGQPTKVIGRLSDTDGIGVLGEATGSGTTYGVLGQASSSDGYGLATPDDAEIEGRIDTNETDFVVEAGTQSTDDAQNVVLGHASNAVTGGAVGATIGGGGSDDGSFDYSNEVTANYGTVGGGSDNTASGERATVGGGAANIASGERATVGGGAGNIASGNDATVGGCSNNIASGKESAVCGGFNNEAYGQKSTIAGGQNNRTGKDGTFKGLNATVAGGKNNVAREDYSFAAGREAYARAKGSFVWGDSSTDLVESKTQDEVVFQANGGVVMWTSTNNSSGAKLANGDSSWSAASARAVKSNIDPVDPGEVLAGVEDMEVSTWEYDTRRGVTHMGPMAGEFYDAFGLGDDEERISTVDADGVALAAIQGLAERLAEKDGRIDDLEAENAELHEQLTAVEDRLASLEVAGESQPAADD